MNTSIVGRHITLSEEIKTHINDNIQTFDKYHLDIISVSAIIFQEQKHGKNIITFEYVINVSHQDTIVVKQKDADLYSAVDIATNRVAKILRRHHDKISGHKKQKLTDIDIQDQEDKIALQLELLEDEIVPVRLKSYKPQTIEDALAEFKSDSGTFKLFYDLDDNLRVLYKRKDEISYGLY